MSENAEVGRPESTGRPTTETTTRSATRAVPNPTSLPTNGSPFVSWWETYEYVQRVAAAAGVTEWPPAGTPAWLELPDTDPRKMAALLYAGTHHCLRVETAQEARAEASRNVAAAVDWRRLATELESRRQFRTQHPWAERKVVGR
jgi:hypothetical protein